MGRDFEDFVAAYIAAMLWSSVMEPEGLEDPGACITDEHTASDLAPEAMERVRADCTRFWETQATTIEGATCTRNGSGCTKAEQAGHDFWLTRAGHGAGFWDGDWSEPQAQALTAASKAFGEQWPYVGDDGLIYL